MTGMWLTGFICIILFRAFYAGLKSKELFYRGPKYSFEDKNKRYWDENALFAYCMWTVAVAFSWIVSLPLIALYKLGQRLTKEA